MLNLNVKESGKKICDFKLPEHRFNELVYPPWHIVDDTYNANPLSMTRMLEASAEKAAHLNIPLFLILGELYELGSKSSAFHNKIGEQIGKINPAYLLYKGNYMEQIVKGIHKNNPTFSSFAHIPENIDVIKLLSNTIFQQKNLPRGGVILLKGSRANKLDQIFLKIKNLLTQDKPNVL